MQAICDAGTDWSEGVALKYNFVQGQTYKVSLAIRNVPYTNTTVPIDLDFVLLQNPISYTYNPNTGCSETPVIPAIGALIADSVIGFSQNSWQVISFTISNLQSNYSQLWFRTQYSSGAPQQTTFFCFDSVCIEQQTNTSQKCYTFDDTVITDGSAQQNAFNDFGNGNPGFLQDWVVVSGTPSIEPSGALSGVAPYNGSQYALQAICDAGTDYSEGVALKYPFNAGGNYTVSMAIRNVPYTNTTVPIDIDYVLLQNQISYTYNPNTGCSVTPAIPSSGSLIVDTILGFTQNAWQVISFNITNLSNSYSELWLRTQYNANASQQTTFFCFDDVCITNNEISAIADINNKEGYLLQNEPNPSGNQTVFHFSLQNTSSTAFIVIYNMLGEQVDKINVNAVNGGSASYNSSGLASGLYLYSLFADGRRLDTKRMLVSH